MEEILIIGGGIIGGSIIKALYQNPNYKLHLLDTEFKTRKQATELWNCTCHDSLIDVKRVFLAVPITYAFDYLDMLASINYTGTVYDCSSTKYELETYAHKLGLNFVGFHPMCGSEKNGFEHSTHDLFIDKKIICSVQCNFTQQLINDLGATQVIIDCKTHDKLTAQISHVPQLISLLLNDVDDEARTIAGNGFKDMTRISNSSYGMWKPILKTNKENIISELQSLSDDIEKLISELDNDDYEAISKRFNN